MQILNFKSVDIKHERAESPIPEIEKSFYRNVESVWDVHMYITFVSICAIEHGISIAGGNSHGGFAGNYWEAIQRNPKMQYSNTIAMGHHLMRGQIVNLWTAFETLSADLIVTAMNLRPKTIGKRAILAPEGRRGNDNAPRSPDADKKDAHKGISINDLEEYSFDMSKSIGDYIRQSRKFEFASLGGIYDAYKKIFILGNTAPVAELFTSTAEDSLLALELLRNVTVHRGGYTDARFAKQANAIQWRKQITPGELFPIAMEDVHSYNEKVIAAGGVLLDFIVNELDRD